MNKLRYIDFPQISMIFIGRPYIISFYEHQEFF